MFAKPLDWSTPSAGDVILPKTLFGYDVLAYLGQGAGSTLYAVTDPVSRQIYALKHVVRVDEKSERFFQQLQTEFDVGRSVTHPGLRRSIDFKITRTLLRKPLNAALVLELVDGEPLEFHRPTTVDDAVDCFIQVADALKALNDAGWIHCDLKPNNLLRSSSGKMKVIDLGQACKPGTIKERVQGTPDFMAPEQVKCEAVTARTDVFNFGASLYWALCGKHIPTLFNIRRTANSFLFDAKIPSPIDHNHLVPLSLSNLVMECVKSVPAKRPDSMATVTRRLAMIHHLMRHPPAQDANPLNDSFAGQSM